MRYAATLLGIFGGLAVAALVVHLLALQEQIKYTRDVLLDTRKELIRTQKTVDDIRDNLPIKFQPSARVQVIGPNDEPTLSDAF